MRSTRLFLCDETHFTGEIVQIRLGLDAEACEQACRSFGLILRNVSLLTSALVCTYKLAGFGPISSASGPKRSEYAAVSLTVECGELLTAARTGTGRRLAVVQFVLVKQTLRVVGRVAGAALETQVDCLVLRRLVLVAVVLMTPQI